MTFGTTLVHKTTRNVTLKRETIVAKEKHIPSLCLALVIQHAMRMLRIILSCGLSGLIVFFHSIS